MNKAVAFMRQLGAVEYSVKGARTLAIMWGAMVLLNVAVLALYVLLVGAGRDGIWQICYHTLCLAFNAWMFRRYLVKLTNAKRREERQAWMDAMFAEWSR